VNTVTQNQTNEPFLGPISKIFNFVIKKKINKKTTLLMQRPFLDAGADERPGIFFMWPKLNLNVQIPCILVQINTLFLRRSTWCIEKSSLKLLGTRFTGCNFFNLIWSPEALHFTGEFFSAKFHHAGFR
jgi:hypothetical protein